MQKSNLIDPRRDRVRADTVLETLRHRRAFDCVSACRHPREVVAKAIARRCARYLFQVLSDREHREVGEVLRRRHDRWLSHTLKAERDGDLMEAARARAETAMINPESPLRHRRAVPIGEPAWAGGPRPVRFVHDGAARVRRESMHRDRLAFDLYALLRRCSEHQPVYIRRHALPVLLGKVQNSYSWLLPRRGFVDLDKRLSRFENHALKLLRAHHPKVTKDHLVRYRARRVLRDLAPRQP